ncbi:DNA methyltransferase [Microvirga splendida]|uniref:Methyltransferase n=1 Tax=Microvirga splendida TaxID=2795727 RepID=A0ABS0XVJ5_9HYPH|nr:DNA methyltransferase [Microvirga splendida]MBJ6124043.1 hypothetical protein [Microvirga splendida]
MKFAPAIRDARQRAILSQEELAQTIGVTPRAVWLAEQGAGTLKTLIPILDHLRIPIAGLSPASSLGARVQEARLKKRWSLQKLSERSNLSIPTIRGLEQGKGRIASLEAAIAALAPTARVRKPATIRREAPRGMGHSTVQRLVHADCIDFMHGMESRSVDLIVTSPPYNAGKEYEADLSVEEYLNFAERWVSSIPRLLSPTGALWLNVGYFRPEVGQAVPLTYLYYPLLARHGLHLIQEVVWHFEGGLAYSKRFAHRTERWMWLVKDPANYVFHLDDVRDGTLNRSNDQRNNPAGKNPTDYWYFDRVVGGRTASKDKTDHPAQFPLPMIERIVRACSSPGAVVLDPFGGSGTTAAAAYQNGRGFISVEANQRYHEIAKARLERLRKENGAEPPPDLERIAS